MLENYHQLRKGEFIYEMLIEKNKVNRKDVFLDDENLIRPKYSNSSLTPSRLSFFLVDGNNKVDITQSIEKCLKDEIIEDWIKNQQ